MKSADRADSFLRMIQRSRREGSRSTSATRRAGQDVPDAPWGHRLKTEGIDEVVGLVETHGRADTARLDEGLEVVPRSG
jgi:two-component system sensor histidine kinase KdpD